MSSNIEFQLYIMFQTLDIDPTTPNINTYTTHHTVLMVLSCHVDDSNNMYTLGTKCVHYDFKVKVQGNSASALLTNYFLIVEC